MYIEDSELPFKIFGIAISLLIGCVMLLRLSIFLFPEKFDPNFTSHSLTGWTNTPQKLAWANMVEKIAKGSK